jgi:hypothetical protein
VGVEARGGRWEVGGKRRSQGQSCMLAVESTLSEGGRLKALTWGGNVVVDSIAG